jgi:hypothetical protein
VAFVSPLWLFGLVAGGRRLSRLFVRPHALAALDVATGIAMLALAATIVVDELGLLGSLVKRTRASSTASPPGGYPGNATPRCR